MDLHPREMLFVERLEKILDDHESRLRSLERVRWMLYGALSLVAFLLGAIL